MYVSKYFSWCVHVNKSLGRFATTPYSEKNAKNVSDMFVHLTNSSVNKHSDRYELNTGTSKAEMEKGSKRSLKATFMQMGQAGLDVKLARKRMCDVILRVFMAYEQTLREASRSISNTFYEDGSGCYELFGADVMFRADGTPVVLEINYSPQIDAPMPMDRWIKGRLLADTLHLAGHRVPPSKIEEEADDEAGPKNRSMPLPSGMVSWRCFSTTRCVSRSPTYSLDYLIN